MPKSTIITLALFCIVLAGCSSPADIDTPRDKYVETDPSESSSIGFVSENVSFIDTRLAVNYDVSWNTPVRIDTSEPHPVLWMDGRITAPNRTFFARYIDTLDIKLDSLVFDGSNSAEFGHDPNDGKTVRIVTVKNISTLERATVYPDGSNDNKIAIIYSHNQAARSIELKVNIWALPLRERWPVIGDGFIQLHY